MIEEIKKLIEQNRLTYKNQPSRIIADYSGERAFTKDYNGRQILELLQNADDAGTKEVLIELDIHNQELTVSNNGAPFDIDGINSLMLANLSSKNKIDFIGNKGLGFRSILNWASEISVLTKEIELIFSPDIAKREFYEIVKDKEIKNKMFKEKDLLPGMVPFPILAIPDYRINRNAHKWVTTIKIRYKKEFEQDIKDQLIKNDKKEEETGLRPEILLFLNHIEKVEINIDGQDSILEANFKTNDLVQIGTEKWQIEDTENQVMQDEKKHYRIKIAWKKDLSDTFNKLFTYFPTQVSINLPCLIHATFDLDVARNYLNKTDANKYILHELVEILKNLALKISENELSWLPYRLLTPVKRDSNDILVRFYNDLDEIKKKIKVYPCVDGKYRTLDEIKFYNTEFSKWIFENRFSSVFPELLLAPEDAHFNERNTISDKKYNPEIRRNKINEISREIQNKEKAIILREEILSLLLGTEFNPHPEKHYTLLIDKGGKLIAEESVVFTPVMQSDQDFHIPDFLKLEFINRNFYDRLISKHKERFKQGEPDSREINRLFNDIVNIQPYDSNNIFKRVIKGTKKYIENTDPEQHPEIIKKMVQSIFKNYQELKKEDKPDIFSEPFPLVNRNRKVKDADDLFLNASFPSGQLTEDLYEGILVSSDFLIDLDFFELDIDDENLVEEFFIWMGVNKYVKYKTDFEFILKSWETNDFLNFVFQENQSKPQQITNYIYKGTKIADFDNTVAKLPPEKILLLILKDEKIRQKLEDSHGDQFGYNYNRIYHSINSHSYVSFQLISLGYFDDYLIDTHNMPFINQFEINLKSGLLKKYGIDESDLKYLLSKLGAKQSFNDIEPKRIYELLHNYQSNDPEGYTTQKFYTLALNSLENHSKNYGYEPSAEELEGLTVFAERKNDRNRKWELAHEVYYSNDTVLPETILEDKYILNVPKRFGEEKVEKYLGVNLFNKLKLNIIFDSLVKHHENESLKEELENLNKYILALRIQDPDMKIETQKQAANRLKNARITLVENGKYTVDNGPESKLENNEFVNELINTETRFYLCADSSSNLQELKKQPAFCDAISEIYCIVFKVWEQRAAFRSAFIVGDSDLEHQFKKDKEEGALNRAKELLGLSKEESNFWKAVFKHKGLEFPDDIDTKKLNKLVRENLNIPMPETYSRTDFVFFNNDASYRFLKELCNKLNLTLADIRKGHSVFPALRNWHIQEFKKELDNIEPKVGVTLWESLKDKEETSQKQFIPLQNKFRVWFNKLKWDELDDKFEIDYSKTLIDKIKEEFEIEVGYSVSSNPPIIRYKDLLAKSKIEESQLTEEERSLLYFDGHDDRLKEIIEQYKEKEDSVENASENNEHSQGLKIINTSIEDILPQDRKNNGGGKVSGTHNPATDKSKKKAGKKAELLVRDQLVKEYGRNNVQWVSGNSDESGVEKSDAFGYDFRYKKPHEKEMSYLEVKSVTSNSFIISYNEVSVGLKEGGKYHLGLVKDGSLNIVTDFFTNNKRIKMLKQLQSKSAIRPRDYDVYFEITEQVIEPDK